MKSVCPPVATIDKWGVGSYWFGSVCQAQPIEPGWACNRALLRHANFFGMTMTHTGVATNTMIKPERASSMLTAKLDTLRHVTVCL
jgi:hypothetical protein